MTAPQNDVHNSSSETSLVVYCPFPAELESSHGCRADQGFLPRGCVIQPARRFLPAHPVSWTGRDEAQRRPDGLASSLETSPGLLRKEELYR